MSIFWMVLIVIAILLAWYAGYSFRGKSATIARQPVPKDYLVGLNFLLNEEPDKAVDIFVKMLEEDSDIIEMHFAVGKLFRQRGESDRAIRIHQNLIARPNLDKLYRIQALIELGKDYLGAGVLDRAESVFLEVLKTKESETKALMSLLDIYQREKNWLEAMHTANRLMKLTDKNMRPVIAHCHCELALLHQTDGKLDLAEKELTQALRIDKKCVRASLLQAEILVQKGKYRQALKSLKHIQKQDVDYLSEGISLMAQCYEKLKEGDKMVAYLKKILAAYPKMPVVLILSERIRKWKGDKVAANFVADYIRRYPSIRGLNLLVNLHLAMTKEERTRKDLLILQKLTAKLLLERPEYQCINCGFSGKTLHWQCPSCKQWNTVKPLHSLG